MNAPNSSSAGASDRSPAVVVDAVRAALARTGVDGSTPVVVALSGGLDSCVLLHVLRFGLAGGYDLRAAHFDHAMRPASVDDAFWARGLCHVWGVDLVSRRADHRPASEDEARRARYAFLESVRPPEGRLLTAHHADDQAETVLFRALRGTGIDGLAGIPEARAPGLVRPLLEVWREDLEGYARATGLSWRHDVTNDGLDFARNVLRNELLPLAEAAVHPGARRGLVRLSAIAREEQRAWTAALEVVARTIGLEVRTGSTVGAGGRAGEEVGSRARPDQAAAEISLDRKGLAALPPELRGRVLRHVVRSGLGATLDRSATQRAVDFVATGRGGGVIELGGGLTLGLEGPRVFVATP